MNALERLAAADARRDIQNDPDLGNLEETVGGDWQIRGRDADLKLLDISPDVIDAARETKAKFHKAFPGWELHSRVNRGDRVFDRTIAAFGIRMARIMARATKVNGQRNSSYVRRDARRNDWISQCGIDAVEFLITKRYATSVIEAASLLGVDNEVYGKLRAALSVLIFDGFDSYMSELRFQLARVERENARKNLFFA